MRFIRQNGKPEIDFFKEAACAEFRATFDAELKASRKWFSQAESGTSDSRRGRVALGEEYPWDHSPQALLNSVFFFSDICFATHSGDEHHCLRYNDSQIQVVEKPRKACLPRLY